MAEYIGITEAQPLITWSWSMILWLIPIALILWALIKEFVLGGISWLGKV